MTSTRADRNPSSSGPEATEVDRRGGASDEGLYPAVLRVGGRKCVVVGGGTVAARKVAGLRAARADVVVVAPVLGVDLERLREEGREAFSWRRGEFGPEDLEGAMVAVAATGDRVVNARVAHEAASRGVLVNAVDDPEASDLLVPSVLERGPLQVAVSTGGRAPAVSAAVRRYLERTFSEDWAEVVEYLGEVRKELRDSGRDEESRRRLNQGLAGLDFGSLIEEGGADAVRRAVQQRLRGAESCR